MIQEIKTMEDVKTFLQQIAAEIDNFSPAEDFSSYVYPGSSVGRYTEEESGIRNANLNSCIAVCDLHVESAIEYIEWFYDLKRLCIEHEQV
jgi:hypothetical protein